MNYTVIDFDHLWTRDTLAEMKLNRSSLVTITCLVAVGLSGWQPSALAGSDPRHATSSVQGVYDLKGNLIDRIPEHAPHGSILSLPGVLLKMAAWSVVGPAIIVVGGIEISRMEARETKVTAAGPRAEAVPAKRRVRRR